MQVASAESDTLDVPITFRDVIALPIGDGVRHPDFQKFSGNAITYDLVASELDDDGKPVYTAICEAGNRIGPCPCGNQTTSKDNFDTWYRDVSDVNLTKVGRLSLEKQGDGSFAFLNNSFFPWDGDGWIAAGQEADSDGHNFGFTSEIRYWFEFKRGEHLTFSGDDDVWVFINRKLAVDIGGVHPAQTGDVVLNEGTAASFEMIKGRVYESALFHAERHTNASNFNLTLSDFSTISSVCEATCGDGIVAGKEVCDDGVNDGVWGSCMSDCSMGPYCGDGILDPEFEQCDDGINLTIYSADAEDGCTSECDRPAFCGDGIVDSLFGEECDDGENNGEYGGCGAACRLEARCGDGIVQIDMSEQCDDGNTVSGDGCSSTCLDEIVLV